MHLVGLDFSNMAEQRRAKCFSLPESDMSPAAAALLAEAADKVWIETRPFFRAMYVSVSDAAKNGKIGNVLNGVKTHLADTYVSLFNDEMPEPMLLFKTPTSQCLDGLIET